MNKINKILDELTGEEISLLEDILITEKMYLLIDNAISNEEIKQKIKLVLIECISSLNKIGV